MHSSESTRRNCSENLREWLEYQREREETVSIDGRTICGSGNAKHKAYHAVSAFVTENHIALGELKTEEKSNEITAVPELLDMLDIEGVIVTADATSCQEEITRKVVEKEADYVLSVKGNQPTLLADIQEYFDVFSEETVKSRTLEKGHVQIETRAYFLEPGVEWLAARAGWAELNAIGAVRAKVEENGKIRSETRCFITSLLDISFFKGNAPALGN